MITIIIRSMGFISRLQAARKLGVSPATVASYDSKFLLPVRVPSLVGGMRPHVYYDEIDVENARPEIEASRKVPSFRKPHSTPYNKRETTWRGRLATKLFLLFDGGATFSEAVTQTGADPAIASEFYEQYHSSPEERSALKAIESQNEFSFRKYRYKTAMALREKELVVRELEARATLKALDLAEQGKLDIRSYEKLIQTVHDRYRQAQEAKAGEANGAR